MIFSGIRPTANLHIGNYLGGIKNWVKFQNESKDQAIFCIVDLHALTTAQGQNICELSYHVAACYLACGLDPEQSIIFVQSYVPQHTELAWLLGCHVPLGWLNRMTQFKEKAEKSGELWGLLSYPVLQAADILLYKTTHVPVGEDQRQHIELTRDIANSINTAYQKEIFVVPEVVIQKEGARIMSLQDGTSKMGKSDNSDLGRINLTDEDDIIAKKIKKAKTDSELLPSEVEGLAHRPEAKNLLTMIALLKDQPLHEIVAEFSGQNFSAVKTDLIDVIIAKIGPIREKIKQYDHQTLQTILNIGNDKALHIAQKNCEFFYKELHLR